MPKFFCDENITAAIYSKIKKYGFEVKSVKSEGLFGIRNGDLFQLVVNGNFTFITFDKDFLIKDFEAPEGIIIIDIHPTRDSFVLPVLEKLLDKMKHGLISIAHNKFLLTSEFE